MTNYLIDLSSVPQSVEAEQKVLGAILISQNIWDLIAPKINETFFYHPYHRVIYSAIKTLAFENKPVDVLTTIECIKSNGLEDEIGDISYVGDLARSIYSVENIDEYVRIITDYAIRRQIIEESNKNILLAQEKTGEDVFKTLGKCEQNILDINARNGLRRNSETIQQICERVITNVKKREATGNPMTGISTGLLDLDDKTRGLQPSELSIVAAPNNSGKTAFAISVALDVAIKQKLGVLMFSMEMTGDAITTRMLSNLATTPYQQIASGQCLDWSKVNSALEFVRQMPIVIDESQDMSLSEMRSIARSVHKQMPLGLIIVDYLQLMDEGGDGKDTRNNEIERICKSLKKMARDLDVHVMALSQLNRNMAQRIDKRPIPSDLRDSGSIEQVADLILFLHRPCNFDENADKTEMEIILAKVRNGEKCTVHVEFIGENMAFRDKKMGLVGYLGDGSPYEDPF